jgi:hypothetical protein
MVDGERQVAKSGCYLYVMCQHSEGIGYELNNPLTVAAFWSEPFYQLLLKSRRRDPLELIPNNVPLEHLLLDPNNYRFQNDERWRSILEERYADAKVQERTLSALRDNADFGISLLKDSIVQNGFVPLELIVVRPFLQDSSRFIVVEGNRRVAALKLIREDNEAGISLPELGLRTLPEEISVLVLDPAIPGNEDATQTLMAIRHVAGVNEWGAYQQARLIVELIGSGEANYTSVGKKLGMSAKEVARRYRASMALSQMQNDDEYSSYAKPHMHGLFQETFATTSVRDWLEWKEDEKRYRNQENLERFYSWISDTGEQKPKITSVFDVRFRLKAILKSPQALEALDNSEYTLEDAFALTSNTTSTKASSVFEAPVKEALKAVTGISASLLRALSAEQVSLLEELKGRIEEAVTMHRQLQETAVDS